MQQEREPGRDIIRPPCPDCQTIGDSGMPTPTRSTNQEPGRYSMLVPPFRRSPDTEYGRMRAVGCARSVSRRSGMLDGSRSSPFDGRNGSEYSIICATAIACVPSW